MSTITPGWGGQWETLETAINSYYGGGIAATQYQQVVNMLNSGNYTMEEMATGFNPIQVYKSYKVNWFGCIMLVLLAHTFFLIMAVVYWFYKLCTVGRKDEK